MHSRLGLLLPLVAAISFASAQAAQRRESFERDPGWDGHNNRSTKPERVRQDFGWSSETTHVGGEPGELGGWINPAAEPAYYAKSLPKLTFLDPLSASGSFRV